MAGFVTGGLHGLQRICGSRHFCKVFPFMLVFKHSLGHFFKGVCFPRKGEEESLFCNMFSRKGKNRKLGRRKIQQCTWKRRKTRTEVSESEKAYAIAFLLCYRLSLLGWPWPSPLAAVQEGRASGAHPVQEQQAEAACKPPPTSEQEPGH